MDEAIRRVGSARELLRALADSFPQALEQDRMAAWAKAAHSIIDLLAEQDADVSAPRKPQEGGEK